VVALRRRFGAALAVDGAGVLGLAAWVALRGGETRSRAIGWADVAAGLLGWLAAVAGFRALGAQGASGRPRAAQRRAARWIDVGLITTVGGAAVLAVIAAREGSGRAARESGFLVVAGAAISGVYLVILGAGTGLRPRAQSRGSSAGCTPYACR
jgi:hypothetical protein